MAIDFSNTEFEAEGLEEPLVTTSLTREDEGEYSLRPKTLREYIGQEKAKGNLEVFIQAAKMRHEPLDHVLLHGPPGLGKTTLSGIIANEMGVNVRITSGPAIEKAGDLAALLTNLNENDILFVDEIHRLNRAVEEVLYPAMEDYAIDIIIGKGPSANSIRLDLPRFTLIGATTRAGQLSAPLRDRFGVTLRLELYSPEELALIVTHLRSSPVCLVTVEDTEHFEITVLIIESFLYFQVLPGFSLFFPYWFESEPAISTDTDEFVFAKLDNHGLSVDRTLFGGSGLPSTGVAEFDDGFPTA